MATRQGKRKADQAGQKDIWREKLQFLSDALESTSQPFGAGSPEGSTMIFNEAFCQLTGYTREELYHINWATDLTTPESRTGELEALAVLDRTHEPQRYEKYYRRKDGTIIPIELLAHVALDSQGRILYYYSFITDISDRKRKEETVLAARDEMEVRVAERTSELEAANENLQIKGEELEMQAEEIQSQNEELRTYNEEMGVLTRSLQERETELSQLAAIVTSSDDAIIGKTLDGTIISWNAAAEKIYGYSETEALGRTIDIIVPPAFSGELRAMLKKIGTGQRVEHQETQRVTKDGRLIETSITISPIADRDGKVIGASTIARDITAAKAAENALKKSQFILAKSQEMARVGNWAWNVQTGEMKGSDENFRLYGYQPGDVTPTVDWVRACVLPGDLAAMNAFVEAVRRDGVKKSIDYSIRRRDGTVRYLMTVADKIVRDKAGHVRWVYGITQDITGRKKAEEASRENERRLERSQGIAHLGSWELDLVTNRLSWSDEVYRIFGLRPQEFGATYEAFLEAVHPDDRAAVDAAYTGSVRDGKDTYEIEHRIVRKPKGEVRVVQEKCEHFRDGSGRIVRSVGMVHDITERKRLEEALKEREKQLTSRLNAILSPGRFDDKTIAEIVDIPSLQEMADSFHELTGVANAIIDLNGVVLVGSGWQDICTKFHRCHPETLKNCIESDRHLSGSVEEGKYAVYKCKNGMWDAVTPIVLSGRHIANLFIGQFFFDDEVPDYDYFRRQSGIYNFDRDEYMTALEKVPRHSREKIGEVMGFYTRFAAMVSQLSYSNVQLAGSLIRQRRSEQALQEKMEEIEVQAEEMETQNEEISKNYEVLNEVTRSLHESEALLRAVTDTSPDVIFVKDRESRIVLANPATLRAIGKPPEKVVGKNDREFYDDPEIGEMMMANDRRVMESGQTEVIEEVVQTPGGLRTFLSTKTPFRNPRGEITGILGVSRDITDRKQAEEVRQATLQRFYNILSNMRAAVLLVTQENRIEYANQALCDYFDLDESPAGLLGLSASEIIGMIQSVYAHPDESVSRIKEIVDGRLPVIGEEVAMRDGRTCLRDFVPLSINGESSGRLWIHIDITERKQAEEELKEAKAQAELYLDLMGHDISNMHQIALSQLELAQEIMADEGQIAGEAIEMITTPIETLERSARLIENVGKLQKLRAGEYRLEPVDLGKVLSEVVEENCVPGNGAAIRLSGAAGCRVKANPLIKEAFTNLVGNAVKHTHGSPEINVDVSRVAENGSSFYRIAIEDNGPGIPDEKKGEIFHRFKRGQTKAKGTGLGLYIARTLVENFKGRIQVEDRVPGDYSKGSKFIVYLPVADD